MKTFTYRLIDSVGFIGKPVQADDYNEALKLLGGDLKTLHCVHAGMFGIVQNNRGVTFGIKWEKNK